jgi:hypothetical protein
MDRARDELFSHINRCGVLQAEEADQRHWMDETIEYLGERYPDLADNDLKQLYEIGIRFCKPAIAHGRPGMSAEVPEMSPEVPEMSAEVPEMSPEVPEMASGAPDISSEMPDMEDAGVA